MKRDPEPDPVIERYKRHVDQTLLRENLRKTYEQRLRDLMDLQRCAEELRRTGRMQSHAAPRQNARDPGEE